MFYSPLYSQQLNLSGMRYELNYEQDKILMISGFMLIELKGILFSLRCVFHITNFKNSL